MRQSDNIADLAAALAKAQGAFKNPEKDREVVVGTKSGSEYKFKYATFTAVVDSVRQPLAENGLSFVQITAVDEQGHLITTRLMHATGQWLEFDTPVFVGGPGAQAFGSGVTYAKRYALSTLLGVTADEDDDANTSEGNKVDMRERAPKTLVAQEREFRALQNEMSGGGRKQSQYEATKEKLGGMTPYMANKAKTAETWANNAIVAIGKLPTDQAISTWWIENEKELERLQEAYPALYDKVSLAADERLKQVPMAMAAG